MGEQTFLGKFMGTSVLHMGLMIRSCQGGQRSCYVQFPLVLTLTWGIINILFEKLVPQIGG